MAVFNDSKVIDKFGIPSVVKNKGFDHIEFEF
jgi:hypothetical protein